jgi:hypothetical protein
VIARRADTRQKLLAEHFVSRGDNADVGIFSAIAAELLGVLDEYVGVDDRVLFVALYQPSIQVSTILMVSSPLSRNCLQLMVARSSLVAWAGMDESESAAANRSENVVFINISIGA